MNPPFAPASRFRARVLEDGLPMKLFLLLMGAGCFWEVRVIGAFTLSEIALLGLAVIHLKDVRTLFSGKIGRTVLLLAGVWLASQVATDLYRASPFRDWSRGWGRIVIWTANFSVLYLWLHGNLKRAAWLIAGFAVGLVLYASLRIGYWHAGALWKFGLALPALYACGLLFARWPGSPLYGLALLGLSGVGIALSFRSYSGVCLAGVALWIAWLIMRRQERPFAVRKVGWSLAGASAIALVAGVFLYSTLALNNAFGDDERYRTQEQMRRGIGLLGNSTLGEPIGLIAGARGEFLVAIRAVMDSPLLGHGSWAKNPLYNELWLTMAGEARISEVRVAQVELVEPGLIPSHSHVLGAWVDAGIGGGVFWIYALGLCYAVLALCLCTRQPLTTYVLPVYSLFLWDIFFSPFSTQSRLFSAFYIALAACLLERHFARLKATAPPTGAARTQSVPVVGQLPQIPPSR